MRMMDCVELIAEKPKYAKEGVHKGMQGVIWEESIKMAAGWFFSLNMAKKRISQISVSRKKI